MKMESSPLGNVVHSATLYMLSCTHQLSAGFPISKCQKFIDEYEDVNKKLGVFSVRWASISIRGLFDALVQGKEYSILIEGKEGSINELFEWLLEKDLKTEYFSLSYLVLLLNLVFCNVDTAWKYCKKGSPLRKDAIATPFKEHFLLYEVLAAGFCYDMKSEKEQKEMRKICKSNIKELKHCMDQQYENYAYKYWMACGEYACIVGDFPIAHDNYRKGIILAKENGFLQDTAIAFERCSRMMLSLNDQLLAKTYMKNAIDFYSRWGAKSKVTALEQEFTRLFPKKEKAESWMKEMATSTTTGKIGDMVDIQAYIDAAEAISEQIELESLMKILVTVVVKNAGAEHVVLLTQKENSWFVTAEKEGASKKLTHLQLPLDEASGNVPLTVIGDVIKSKKELVIKDALVVNKYNQDPYVVDTQCHSILCLPLIYQNKMLAVLYLENSLTEGAFTEERVQNVLLLSSHIANALENALLYEELKEYSKDLEIKVQERTKEIGQKNQALNITLDELKKTQKQLIASEQLASLGELTAGIAHEIRDPLNFINNFSTLNINIVEKDRGFFGNLMRKRSNG